MSSEHFWLLDARRIWNGNKITDAAPEALRLVSTEEQEKAKKFYFLKDSKLSLGSSLLKRLYARKSLGVAWRSAEFTRKGDPKHGKPAVAPSLDADSRVDFNVSHQAGLVALAGCSTQIGLLGVDVTCANERNDQRVIDEEGFDSWIDMHEYAFSAQDLDQMKTVTDHAGQPLDAKAKIRRFYAFWCLKEAYVKLEGEALLAPWLKDVEFRNVRVPRAAAQQDAADQAWGEKIPDIQVWIRGQQRQDVTMVLQAFGEAYFIGTAVKYRPDSLPLDPAYSILDPHADIYPAAAEP